MVHTESGGIPIGEIVARKMGIRALSWSEARQQFEMQPITAWHTTPASDIYELLFSDGTTLRCTPEHKLLVAGGNWTPASDVPIGASVMIGGKPVSFGSGAPIQTFPDVVDVGERHAITSGQDFTCFGALRDLYGLLGVQLGHRTLEIKCRAMTDRIGMVFRLRAIAKVIQSVIGAVAVKVASLMAGEAWAYEGARHQAMHCRFRGLFDPFLAQADQSITAWPYGADQNAARSAIGNTITAHLTMRQAANTSQVGGFVPGEIRDRAPNFMRLVSRRCAGHEDRTYCLTVRDNHNFVAGGKQGIVVSNSKTNVVAIAWPVWTWARRTDPDNPLVGPGVRFLCASYGANKAQQDGVTARRLIGSAWFQELWGSRVRIAKDRDNQEQYDTTAGGSRISTGIPESLGKGGIIRIIDDPVKTDEVESEKVMDSVIRAYKEVWSTRSNNSSIGAEVIIMQRLGERDLSGYVLDEQEGWTHLCLPARYDPAYHCSTRIGWSDPRTEDGEILAPNRFPERELRRMEREAGPYAWAGQFQQMPEPRGGGIIKTNWWQLWPPEGEEESWTRDVLQGDHTYKRAVFYPDWELVIVSVDTAYGLKEENDWSGVTVWGTFTHQGRVGIMLIGADRVRLDLHELVKHLRGTCERRKADVLLVENRSNGADVTSEMRRLMRGCEWSVYAIDAARDKVARLHSVVSLFSGGVIYAPKTKWSRMVIDEVGSFPKGKNDDLVDAVSMALNWLRKNGIAQLQNEVEEDDIAARTFVGQRESVAEGYGL